jgi:hypothetical protein
VATGEESNQEPLYHDILADDNRGDAIADGLHEAGAPFKARG